MLGKENPQSIKQCYSNETFCIDECHFGLGVFANRKIQKGEIILVFGGNIIDFQETKRRGIWECMPIQIGPNQYIDTTPPGVFVNHSCDPNAGIHHDTNLVSLRIIDKGEQITFDYSTTMEEKSFTMECLCKSPQCRKIVADFSTLPRAVQKRYYEQQILMRFIATAFEKSLKRYE